MAFEQSFLHWIYSLAGSGGFIDEIFIVGATMLVYVLVLIFLMKLLVHREPYERLTKIFYASFAFIVSVGVLQGILSQIILRDAPATILGTRGLLAYGGTFPSLAVTWASASAMIVFLVLSRRLGAWLFIGAAVVGFSQLYAGVHWPLDVIISFIIGIIGPIVAKRVIPPTRS